MLCRFVEAGLKDRDLAITLVEIVLGEDEMFDIAEAYPDLTEDEPEYEEVDLD
jgi:hypothetical protein